MGELDPIFEFVYAGGSIEIGGFAGVFPKSWYQRPLSDEPSGYTETPVHRLVPTGNLRRL